MRSIVDKISNIKYTLVYLLLFVTFSFYSLASDDQLKISYSKPRQGLEQIFGSNWVIFLDGPIDPKAGERFEIFLNANEVAPNSEVVFNSPGGSLLAGIQIGRAIRKSGFSTSVGVQKTTNEFGLSERGPGRCYSACAIAFLGGKFRYLSNELKYGVHRFYFDSPKENAGDVAQVISAILYGYISEMGIENRLLSIASVAGKKEMIEPSRPELEELGVINNGATKVIWTIEGREGRVYAKGERETVFGINKFIVLCSDKKQPLLYSIFDPQGRDQEVMGFSAISIQFDDEYIRSDPLEKKIVNGWVNAIFIADTRIINKLFSAKTIGFIFQRAHDAPMFLGYSGFTISEGREKIRGVLGTCR